MGTHLRNKERPFDIKLITSPWRETGRTASLGRGGIITFFQNEEAIVTGWFDYPVKITHTLSRATFDFQPPLKPLIVGGLDTSFRSAKRFLASRRTTVRGVDIWFTVAAHDTWHYEQES